MSKKELTGLVKKLSNKSANEVQQRKEIMRQNIDKVLNRINLQLLNEVILLESENHVINNNEIFFDERTGSLYRLTDDKPLSECFKVFACAEFIEDVITTFTRYEIDDNYSKDFIKLTEENAHCYVKNTSIGFHSTCATMEHYRILNMKINYGIFKIRDDNSSNLRLNTYLFDDEWL